MGYQGTLVKTKYYRKPLSQTWGGSLSLPQSVGGHGQGRTTLDFEKLIPGGWMFNVKFATDDSRINNIIRMGTSGANGYKIVKETRNGFNALTFQEMKTFTSTVRYYPPSFNVTAWHHIAITWVPASASAVTVYIYVDGILLTRVVSNITWSAAVYENNPIFILGSDSFSETLYGHINDVAFFNQQILPDDIFLAKNHRTFTNAAGLWKCDELTGTTLYDSIGSSNLTLFNSAALTATSQSYNLGTRTARP